jgi:hypothetical protein
MVVGMISLTGADVTENDPETTDIYLKADGRGFDSVLRGKRLSAGATGPPPTRSQSGGKSRPLTRFRVQSSQR